jgi:filamentous hemagglutinin family protein
MSVQRFHNYLPAMLAGISIYTAGGIISISHSEVTSSGLGTTVNVTAGVYDITGGARPLDDMDKPGTNLFHSFGDFSVDTTQSAVFLNDSGLATSNIISLVTDGNPSNILGSIDSTDFGGANMYLINPAGIVFGADAQLNVGGSFHASTADYIKLGSGEFFYAKLGQGSDFTVSAPSAFGFLEPNGANHGSIEVHTGWIDETFWPTALLEVPEGETLSLVGGDIILGTADFSTSGFLLAPAGTVNLVSVASAGEVVLGTPESPISIDDPTTQLGDISLLGGSIVDASNIYIRGGNLVIDESVIVPGGFAYELSFVGFSPAPDGGVVDIEVTDDLIMTGTDLELLTLAAPGIFVYTGDFFLLSDPATAPDVNIDAGSVSISGVAGISVTKNAAGEGGNVAINADDVTIESGGSISLVNAFANEDPTAPGPNLTINTNTLNVSGDGSYSAYGFEGIAAQGLVHLAYNFDSVAAELVTANSGNITINATDSVNVTGFGQITTDNKVFGNAGDITINTGDLLVEGTGDNHSAFIGSQSAFAGDGGDIVINTTGGITLKDGARISSATLGMGNAGDVTLNAAGPITLIGADSRILGATYHPSDETLNSLFLEVFYWYSYNDVQEDMGDPNASQEDALAFIRDVYGELTIVDLDLTPGNGGAVTINAPLLTLNEGTRIETSTGYEGNAGSVTANIDSLFVNGGGVIRSTSGVEFLDGTAHVGSGNGGAININATDSVSISGTGSTISTSTFGDGDGGDINLKAGNSVNIQNGGVVSADSGGTLAGVELAGSGLAGDITINGGKEISLVKGTVSTRAITSDGGNTTLVATDLIYLENSEVTTSVESGTGGGGNINIDPDFVILKQSSILANAFGGPGGNINIVAGNFIATPDSSVDASSALGIDGTVNISSPDDTVSEDLAVLPDNYLDVTSLLGDRCGTSPGSSSLVDAGPGGRIVDPDGYLPSFVATTNYNNEDKNGDKSVSNGKRWWAPYANNQELTLAQITCTY